MLDLIKAVLIAGLAFFVILCALALWAMAIPMLAFLFLVLVIYGALKIESEDNKS